MNEDGAAMYAAYAAHPDAVQFKSLAYHFSYALMGAAALMLVGLVRRRGPPRSWIGLALSVVPLWIGYALTDGGVSDFVAVTVLYGGSWAVGQVLRERGHRSAELAERAERAERDREAEAARAVAEERARIARELHDVMSHSISMFAVQTQAVRRRLGPEHAREVDDLRAVESTARQAMAEMRRPFGVRRADGERPSLTPSRAGAARPADRGGAGGRFPGVAGRRGDCRAVAARPRAGRLPGRAGGADRRPQARARTAADLLLLTVAGEHRNRGGCPHDLRRVGGLGDPGHRPVDGDPRRPARARAGGALGGALHPIADSRPYFGSAASTPVIVRMRPADDVALLRMMQSVGAALAVDTAFDPPLEEACRTFQGWG